MEFKRIPIECPKCKAVVMHYNGITKMTMTTRCVNCNNYVVFNPEKNETRIGKEPDRKYSSGMRLY